MSLVAKGFIGKCDTDTVAAIAGGIAAAYYGSTLPDADVILKKYLTNELYNLLML
jgi:ADP-ribosylglycohydrolase